MLYAVLVVLPSIVFGGLHWHQILTDHGRLMARAPRDAAESARHVYTGIAERVKSLLHREEERPWYEYQVDYYSPRAFPRWSLIASPLVTDKRPLGLISWFAYDFADGTDALIESFHGSDPPDDWEHLRIALEGFLDRLIDEDAKEYEQIVEVIRLKGYSERRMPIIEVGVNLSPHRDPECVRAAFEQLEEYHDKPTTVREWDLHLRIVEDESGELRILATRRVQIERLYDLGLMDLPHCFQENGFDAVLVQGFFIDPTWLLHDLPKAIASERLVGPRRLLLPGEASGEEPGDEFVHEVDLLAGLDFEVQEGLRERRPELAPLRVAISTRDITERFRATAWRFLGVGAMMLVSLGLGMWLLVRSVQASLEEARRTENFVAAITHELRTPIAAVKMYGEMLHEGWISDPAKKADYLERILRETNRLDVLVDRVIEKRKLGEQPAEPQPGDLNVVVQEQVPDLLLTRGTYGEDLKFKLGPDLPSVFLIPECVHGVLVNLVENARKYAPVRAADPNAEPILVETRREGTQVVLEVADRGPGIPDKERSKVFRAFYRLGDERTRTTSGTGLGLHLVWLQSRAMGARVEVLPRAGGGSVFRVTFRSA